MTPQYSHPTRLSDYIACILPWAHGHQRKAIGDFGAAIIEHQTACQAQLARSFGNQEAAVKRVSRLLHNERLDPRVLADAVPAIPAAGIKVLCNPIISSVRQPIGWLFPDFETLL